LTGNVPHAEAPAYVRTIDIAVAPCAALEHFYFSPLKILEYMACGKAVVATSIGQITDTIRDGQNGILVPPDDRTAWVDTIRDLAHNEAKRQALGEQAARDVHSADTWEHRVAHILSLATGDAGVAGKGAGKGSGG
jgi:glycosyltransferase involved in cell wall biosynthesis